MFVAVKNQKDWAVTMGNIVKAEEARVGAYYDFIDYALEHKLDAECNRMINDHYGEVEAIVPTEGNKVRMEVLFHTFEVSLEVPNGFALEEVNV